MKLCPELLDLSREHHFALKLALDAKKAASSGAAATVTAMASRVQAAMAGQLEAHFQAEELHLLPVLLGACPQLVARTLAEHVLLRQAALALDTPQPGLLLAFAELLQAHVRFEERELFAAVRQGLPGSALAALRRH